MRKSLFVTLLFFLSFAYTSNSFSNSVIVKQDFKITPSDNSALEYNDKIVRLQMVILEDLMKTMKLEGKNIIKDLKGTIKVTKKSIKTLQKMDVYPGGEQMQSKGLDLFNFYLETMEGPWMEAFILFNEKGMDMSKKELTRFQDLLTKPAEEEVKYDEAFAKAQNTFAKANGFEIQRNTMQDEIDGL